MRRRTFLTSLAGTGLAPAAGCPLGRPDPSPGVVTCGTDTATARGEPAIGTVDGAWPAPHFDRRNTGHAPDATGPGACPRTQWHFSLANRGEHAIDDPPAVVGGTVFAADHRLYALDAADGTVRWTTGDPPGVTCPPTVAGGDVHVANENGLFAVDAATGTARRLAATGADVTSAPTVAGGVVFVGTDAGEVVAADRDGGTLWRTDVNAADETLDAGVLGKPAVAGGTVYVGTYGEAVHALDAATGDERWRRPLDSAAWGAPTVGDDLVYVPEETDLGALRPDDGSEAWRLLDGGAVAGSPALADGTLYVQAGPAVGELSLVAADAATGRVEWQVDLGLAEASPTVVDGRVYLGRGNDLVALDADGGGEVWRMAPLSDVHGPPAVADGTVFLSATEAGVFAVG